MKKLLAFLGGTALAAAVIPYAYKKNEETDEKTIQALLWKASIQPDPDEDGKSAISLSLGFHNPFKNTSAEEEADLFAEEVTIAYTPCENTCACEDEEGCEETPAEATAAEEAPAEETVAEETPVEETPAEDEPAE